MRSESRFPGPLALMKKRAVRWPKAAGSRLRTRYDQLASFSNMSGARIASEYTARRPWDGVIR